MLAKRIIPCLDVTGGRVVKGVNFVELRDAGDPVEIAARYNDQGADELTFLDITATSDARDVILHIIEAVASQVFIPLTVGGGVRTVDDVRRMLNAGADKVSFNSAAIANPQVIRDASAKYGAQCIVVAIDAKRRTAEDEQRMGANGLPVGPGVEQAAHVFHSAHTAAHGERDEDLAGHGFDDVQDHVAAVAGGGDVQKREFVGALLVVAGRDFDRVSCVAQFDKVDTLDHATTGHVKAGNDAFGEHVSVTLLWFDGDGDRLDVGLCGRDVQMLQNTIELDDHSGLGLRSRSPGLIGRPGHGSHRSSQAAAACLFN